ncbi:DUF2225 domain-containing protein [Paenibacillus sp. 481]|uniref:DUF2225 domain-containing protein n=1 Tax=Paenibacillus sp. 481 TaxID=2835869 RepID=UPI001E4F07A0|nr:DUF2225 domain-containing protein [Paenibacillus sp. 481]UHA74654.1 DUF2225 domain-containing protein [Paenibacillus sp. 481]
MIIEALFQIDADCPYCEHTFKTSRVRSSFKRPYKMDSDFCPHYKEDRPNPDFYVVRVCPKCGCASTEHATKRWLPHQRVAFEAKVAKQWQSREYGGERSWEIALETYQLALVTAQAISESQRVIAGLLHHMAWLFRYRGAEELEKRYLQFALDAYINTYEQEWRDQNDAKLIYMIGEMHLRLSQYNDAAKCFARIIHDKRIMDASVIRAAREQWVVMRERMAADKLGEPDVKLEEKSTKLKYISG